MIRSYIMTWTVKSWREQVDKWKKLAEEEKYKILTLKGHTVTLVEYFMKQDQFIVTFDNGLKLTALDGEYGDNAFSFVSDNEYTQLKEHNNVES
jgi:hypothetical protein